MPATGSKRKGPWSREEDTLLKRYIREYGTEDCWRNVPDKAGLLRSGKSCRMRWVNYLRPDVKHGSITAEEQDLIVRLHKLIGNRWSLIAGRLPGRTDNEIKNFWKCYVRKEHGIDALYSNTHKRHKTDHQHCMDQRSDINDTGGSAMDLNALNEVRKEKMMTASGLHAVGHQTLWKSNNGTNEISDNRIPQCDSIAATVIPNQRLEITLPWRNRASGFEPSKLSAGKTNDKSQYDQSITVKSSPFFIFKGDLDPENHRRPSNWALPNCLPLTEHPTIKLISSSESSSFYTDPASSSGIRETSSSTSYVQQSPFESSSSHDRYDYHMLSSPSLETFSSASYEKEGDLEMLHIDTSKSQFPFSSAGTASEKETFSDASLIPHHTFVETELGANGTLINDMNWMDTADHVDKIHNPHYNVPLDALVELENTGCRYLHSPTIAAAWE